MGGILEKYRKKLMVGTRKKSWKFPDKNFFGVPRGTPGGISETVLGGVLDETRGEVSEGTPEGVPEGM